MAWPIHVFRLLDPVLKRYRNVMMAPFRFRTVWGSSQLYRIYLAGIAELLRHPNWDFFINLSGNFDIILDHFSRPLLPYTAPHAPCNMLT